MTITMKFQQVDLGLFRADRSSYWRWMPFQPKKFRDREEHLFDRAKFEQQAKYEQQAGIAHTTMAEYIFPTHIMNSVHDAIPAKEEKMMSVLEALACLCVQLPQSPSTSNTIACLVSCFNVLAGKSVCSTVVCGKSFFDWSQRSFGCNVFQQQAGTDSAEYDWMKEVPAKLRNWRD